MPVGDHEHECVFEVTDHQGQDNWVEGEERVERCLVPDVIVKVAAFKLLMY